jgi:virginiamycin B lyase
MGFSGMDTSGNASGELAMFFNWLTGHFRPTKSSSSRKKKTSQQLELEPLEERRLFSVTITEFGPTQTPPQPISGNTFEIAKGPDGAQWFTEQNAGKIGRIDTSGHVTEFSVGLSPNATPLGITAGPDGNMWFTDPGTVQIGRITTTADHTITEFGGALNGSPQGITAGPSSDPNSLWFTEPGNAKIGRITTAGVITNQFTNPYPNSSPEWITAGPDQALWFTDDANQDGSRTTIQEIGRVTTGGNFSAFSLNASPLNGGAHITLGPDNALWFTEGSANSLGRIDPTTHQITEFQVPTTNALPVGITTGPDGALWFTEQTRLEGPKDMIGRFDPTASANAFSLFSIPTLFAAPQGITAGPDNALWFAESGRTQVGRVGLGGIVATGVSLTEVQGHNCTDVVANFTDADTGRSASNFTVTINWGDNTPLDTTTGTVTQTGTSPTGNSFSVSGTHTYANKGNFTITVTIHDTADGIDAVTTSTATVISGNEAFVRALYRDVLLRTADNGGLNAWVNGLDSGGLTRSQVAGDFTVSPERRGLEVDQDYLAILGRPSDPVGRTVFVNALLAGASEGSVVLALFLSPEYAFKHDNTAFVQDLYRVALERTGSPLEVAGWVQVLNSGALSRAEVATFFLSSSEAYTLAITENYKVFLRRFPDAGGFGAFFVGILDNTVNSISLSTDVLGSQEYFNLNIAAC